LQGITEAMCSDPAVNDIVDELLIEYSDYIYVKPEYRLLQLLFLYSSSIHAKNMYNSQINNYLSKKLNEDFIKKYSEL
jgi:hypothetical protein